MLMLLTDDGGFSERDGKVRSWVVIVAAFAADLVAQCLHRYA
jgi:hypothetical protein